MHHAKYTLCLPEDPVCKVAALSLCSASFSSFQSKRATKRGSGLRPASTLSLPQPSPARPVPTRPPALCSVSYRRPSQDVTAERARPSPGVSDEDVEAERGTAVQGHTASAWQSWSQCVDLCVPAPVLFSCHSDGLVKYLPRAVSVQELELVLQSRKAPTQAPCTSLGEGVGLPETPCVETQVPGQHCTSLPH